MKFESDEKIVGKGRRLAVKRFAKSPGGEEEGGLPFSGRREKRETGLHNTYGGDNRRLGLKGGKKENNNNRIREERRKERERKKGGGPPPSPREKEFVMYSCGREVRKRNTTCFKGGRGRKSLTRVPEMRSTKEPPPAREEGDRLSPPWSQWGTRPRCKRGGGEKSLRLKDVLGKAG